MNRSATGLLATAFTATLALLAAPANAQTTEKCYGVAKAGENGCAAKGLHSCAGKSNKMYDGQDWKIVKAGTCAEMGGKAKPFEGTGSPKTGK